MNQMPDPQDPSVLLSPKMTAVRRTLLNLMPEQTRWCEVCGKPVTPPHPHPMTKMTEANKLRHFAFRTANAVASQSVTASDICSRMKELQDPLKAAYFALNLASYLPDQAEVLIRAELSKLLEQ